MALLFSGIITPLTTPLDNRGDIDGESLARLIDWQIEKGVHGIFVLGTNGEGNLLMDDQKREVAKIASQCVRGRVPLLCGVSDTSLPRVLSNMQNIEGFQFDAYVSTLPYYCITGSDEQYSFFTGVCDRADRAVMAYNIPSFVKNNIEVEAIERMASHERFAGVKESGDDLERYKKLMSVKAANPRLSFFTGCSHLLGVAYSMGFNGGVVGLANVAPALCSAWYTLCQRGDDEGAKTAQDGILKILVKMNAYRTACEHATTLPGNKAVLKALGIIRESTMVAPYAPACSEDEEVRAICEFIISEESKLEGLLSQSYDKEVADR